MLSAQRIKLETSITIIPSSAEEIANNDDLLIELLIRLPFKSLLIFNSVSKHWLSLISDPDFSDRSLIPRPTSDLFLCNIDHSEYDFIILNSSSSRKPLQLLTLGDDSSKIMVLHSCIGLLLCCSLKVKEFSRYLNLKYFDNYHVFNPTAKQYTMLPPIRARTRVFRAILGIFLAFDPSKSPHCKAIYVRRGGVFWNGAVHWINFRLKSLYLDIEEEKVGEMPMPPTPDGFAHRSFSYFGESRGH
ncbi:hypothetical protein Patl1_20704 [Pistacia atlantica]|uniref:Uncharacterized protein n=1 Tax=Pistacia atlantica TaxID=434234 RepID=A0ACC1BHM9_9ROSI|nr:hypothetical protein Patl1_20704 [Pistacia atlantica]